MKVFRLLTTEFLHMQPLVSGAALGLEGQVKKVAPILPLILI